MTSITIDTLKFAQRLEEAGIDRKQAEAQAGAIAEAMDVGIQDLATKHDLALLETNLTGKIELIEQRTEGRFTLLQWMLGFNLALTIAVLWLLFKLINVSS